MGARDWLKQNRKENDVHIWRVLHGTADVQLGEGVNEVDKFDG